MTKNEVLERNAELLRSIIPGVQAKEYYVNYLNIFNITLFMVAKGFNEALGYDVLNYEEIFGFRSDSDEITIEEVVKYNGRELHNTDEVAEYCTRIRQYVVEEMYYKWIRGHIKRPKQPVDASLGQAVNFNNMTILENICIQKDAQWIEVICCYIGFCMKVADQLEKDEPRILEGYWQSTVELIYVAFAQIVGMLLRGQTVTDWGWFWNHCSQLYLGDFTPEEYKTSMNNAIEYSEIEESIIAKIMEEKMKEMKMAVG